MYPASISSPGAAEGPSSAGPNSGQGTIPGAGTKGTWTDETDIRPTLMYLTGLKDDYEHNGRVVTELLTHPFGELHSPHVTALGACYKQLNSSVGQFGTATLQADTLAIESTSSGDTTYAGAVAKLTKLDQQRDQLAQKIKDRLEGAAFHGESIQNPLGMTQSCQAIITAAE
jgi:hypothetical protein